MHDPLIQIPNYAIEGRPTCRQSKRGGGVALYVQEDLMYKIRNDLSSNNPDIDSCFIELINTGKANIIIVIVYKPPMYYAITLRNLLIQVYHLYLMKTKSAILWETITSTY